MTKQNRKAVVEHLTVLFQRCAEEYPDGKIQIDAGGKGRWDSSYFPATAEGIEQAADHAIRCNLDGYNLYVGVNPRKPNIFPGASATDDDIEVSFFSFADLDTTESVQALKDNNTLPYTFSVTTGRIPSPRVHVYWEHEDVTRNLSAWREIQVGMSNLFHGDKVIDPRRIMRLAGCISYPPPKKQERGYKEELVKIKSDFEDEREPVSSLHLHNTFGRLERTNNDTVEVITPSKDDPLGLGTGHHTDVKASITSMLSGQEWHNSMIRLVAHWVSRGFSDAEIMLMCPAMTLQGYTLKDTQQEVAKAVTSARTKFNVPEPSHDVADVTTAFADLIAEPFGSMVEADLAMRRFLYGEHLIRGYVSATISPGGVGKTTVALTDALAMVTGRKLLQDEVHEDNLKVWHYNCEDPKEELQRRVLAVAKHYKIDTSAFANKLFLNSGRDRPLIVAQEDRETGQILATPDADAVKRAIESCGIDALSVDPFVKTHYANENDNMQMDKVLNIYADITDATGCAIDLVHHVRKAPTGPTQSVAGDINQARGASALSGAVRAARTITQMTSKEGEKFALLPEQHKWFVRIDDAKGNMSMPSIKATWLERKSIVLDNGPKTPLNTEPTGDSVGILHPWYPPDPMEGIDTKAVINVIAKGVEGNEHVRFAPRANANNWVGDVIVNECLGKGEEDAKVIVKAWLKSGLLYVDEFECPKSRKPRQGVYVDFEKAPV